MGSSGKVNFEAKRAGLMMARSRTLPHAPVARSRGTLPHAPVARSRITLPHAARAHAGTTRSQAQNPNGKHIYQRATVKDLKINLLGKITQNGNAYNDDEGKWAPQEKSTFR